MVLVDTSAGIEFLRKTGRKTNLRVRRLIEAGDPLATTDVVIMELLCGGPGADVWKKPGRS